MCCVTFSVDEVPNRNQIMQLSKNNKRNCSRFNRNINKSSKVFTAWIKNSLVGVLCVTEIKGDAYINELCIDYECDYEYIKEELMFLYKEEYK